MYSFLIGLSFPSVSIGSHSEERHRETALSAGNGKREGGRKGMRKRGKEGRGGRRNGPLHSTHCSLFNTPLFRQKDIPEPERLRPKALAFVSKHDLAGVKTRPPGD